MSQAVTAPEGSTARRAAHAALLAMQPDGSTHDPTTCTECQAAIAAAGEPPKETDMAEPTPAEIQAQIDAAVSAATADVEARVAAAVAEATKATEDRIRAELDDRTKDERIAALEAELTATTSRALTAEQRLEEAANAAAAAEAEAARAAELAELAATRRAEVEAIAAEHKVVLLDDAGFEAKATVWAALDDTAWAEVKAGFEATAAATAAAVPAGGASFVPAFTANHDAGRSGGTGTTDVSGFDAIRKAAAEGTNVAHLATLPRS